MQPSSWPWRAPARLLQTQRILWMHLLPRCRGSRLSQHWDFEHVTSQVLGESCLSCDGHHCCRSHSTQHTSGRHSAVTVMPFACSHGAVSWLYGSFVLIMLGMSGHAVCLGTVSAVLMQSSCDFCLCIHDSIHELISVHSLLSVWKACAATLVQCV